MTTNLSPTVESQNQNQPIRHRFCDTREPWEIQEKLIETGWERATLVSGDFMFRTHDFKTVGITRKTVPDLLNSLSTPSREEGKHKGKKFSEHLEEMLDHFELKIILLEGQFNYDKLSGKLVTSRGLEYHTIDMVRNFLRTWWDRGFTAENTSNLGDTIKRLNQLYAYYQKPYHTGGTPFRQIGDERALAFPTGCRGKTGILLLEQFKNLISIANAEVDELMTVKGIGHKKAISIYDFFHRTNKEIESSEQSKLL